MEQLFGILISGIFGAIFGSYSTLFAYRLPRGESCFGRYFGKKSHCGSCNAVIKTRDLIPLINWIFTLGRCRKCYAKIPKTHLFIEVSCTILFILAYLKFSFTEQFILAAIISACSIILITTDFTHKIFPFQVLNLILISSLLNRVLIDQTIFNIIYSSIIGILTSVIFYQVLSRVNIKLFANKGQVFDYIKFILIASVSLNYIDFLLYFSSSILILSIIILLDYSNKKPISNFGYVFIIPFIWLVLI